MSWLKSLWTDESGSVLTAEAVLLGSMGIAGATVGLNMASDSMNEELKDVSRSIRHLDQSYEVAGFSGCRAKTAGSCFQQEDVKKSIKELDKREQELQKDLESQYKKNAEREKERLEELREELRHDAELQRKRAEEEERKRQAPPKKRSKTADDDDD
jgi:DNA repair exonuclease SbcCD ATPase subunit